MNNANQIPIDLDWVTARAQCSLYKMFTELRNGIKDDIEQRNALRQEQERLCFEIGAQSANRFSVFRTSNKGTVPVDFSFENDEIIVADAGKEMFRLKVTLNNEGRCKFVLGGEEFEQWQVRRMALERLFF